MQGRSIALTAAVGSVVALSGCSKPAPSVTISGDPASAPPPGPAASDAAASAGPVCMRPIADDSQPAPSRVEADARSLYVCAGSHEPNDAAPQCFAVDRATGRYRRWNPGPAPTPAPATRPTVGGAADEVEVCKGGTCTKIRVPGATDELDVSTNAAGTHIALVTTAGPSTIELYEVASRKRTARIPLVVENPPCGYVRWVGDAVLVIDTVCAGPDGIGTLYTAKGKKLAVLGGPETDGSHVNADDPQIVHLDGTRYAIGLPMQTEVRIVDSATGKESALIDLDKLEGKVTENGPGTMLVTRGGPRTLLVATGAASIGEIDLGTGALTVGWTAPRCPGEDD